MNKLILFSLLLFLSLNLLARQSITLSTGEWAPYTSQHDPKGRIAQIIVSEAFLLENMHVKYLYFPWEKALKAAKELQVDVTMPWYKTNERKEEYYYSKQAIIRTRIVFFHLKTLDFKWKSYKDLKQYTIGATREYRSTILLKEKQLNISLVSDEVENYKNILNKKIDITASSILVGYDIINKTFSKKQRNLFTYDQKPVFPETGTHLLISKKHPRAKELINAFDQGLKKLIKSGRYEEIIKNFMTRQ
ncbi:MAG: transporter substrate-binding domain-containing protein [Campylobacteraceae bacterium]|nr:transporter substrate-binding domain-containing protein [Campylobacteraceae bacterium]